MSTNFPVNYDDLVNLGGPFLNIRPPADPFHYLDAAHANTWVDSIVAIENRIGKIGDTSTTSIDWALLTYGGTANQGLRIRDANAIWPGSTREQGIFVDTVSGNVCFHKAGDPTSTFTDLTVGADTWNEVYANGNTMDVSGTGLVWTQTGVDGGPLLCLLRNLEASDTNAAVFLIQQINALDDQPAVLIAQNGTSSILDLYDLVEPTSRWSFARDGSLTGNVNSLSSAALSIISTSGNPILNLAGSGPSTRMLIGDDGSTMLMTDNAVSDALYIDNVGSGPLLYLLGNSTGRLHVANDGSTLITATSRDPALDVYSDGGGSLFRLSNSTGLGIVVHDSGSQDWLALDAGNPMLMMYNYGTGPYIATYSSSLSEYPFIVEATGNTYIASFAPAWDEATLSIYQSVATYPLINYYGYDDDGSLATGNILDAASAPVMEIAGYVKVRISTWGPIGDYWMPVYKIGIM